MPRVTRAFSSTRLIAPVVAAVLVAAGAPASAIGAAPALSITNPSASSVTNNPKPMIAGTASEDRLSPLHVTIKNKAAEVVETAEVEFPGPSWLVLPAKPLGEGTYTIEARQEGPAEPLETASVTFREDQKPPAVSISTPRSGASSGSGQVSVAGAGGTEAGDSPSVTVQVFAGTEAAGSPAEALELPVTGGAWSGIVAGLAPGAYTLRAEQFDSAGNTGTSATVTITVLAPPSQPTAGPPVASFKWFPASPAVGEPVTVVSSSTDPSSPIIAYAWALSPTEPLRPGGTTLTTTFATPGARSVRLQVKDAAGRTNVATETILVHPQSVTLMQPFPIVRLAGRQTRSGVRLSLLTVEAPVSSRVTVKIRRARHHPSSVSRVASAGRTGTEGSVLLSFPHFERSIPAGSTLEVSVTKAGEIGKLTRLIPHGGRLPTRQDLCLSAAAKPMRCPSS